LVLEIYFLAYGSEQAYSKFIPALQKTIRFKYSGEMQDIPDDEAKKLISDFPMMFGTSIEKLQKLQGKVNKEIPVVKEDTPKQHPMVKSFKKVEKMVEKTNGHMEQIDKKPVKKVLKRKVTK
jgi:hypothetical protein